MTENANPFPTQRDLSTNLCPECKISVLDMSLQPLTLTFFLMENNGTEVPASSDMANKWEQGLEEIAVD